MWISRVRVNGGFLNGVDVEFAPGLNVVIGPRGTGKTTLLELIRHALGLPLPATTRRGNQPSPILSMLGGGEVIVDIEAESERIHLVVDAQGNGRRPISTDQALMLGQNELEAIAADPQSRLELIDLRARTTSAVWPTDRLRENTAVIGSLREEIRIAEDELAHRSELEQEAETLRTQESEILRSGAHILTELRDSLEDTEARLKATRTDRHATVSAIADLNGVANSERLLRDSVHQLERHTNTINGPALDDFRSAIGDNLLSVVTALRVTLDDLHQASERYEIQERELMAAAAPIRAELEDREAGLGELTSRIGNLDRLLSKLETVDQNLHELRGRLASIEGQREASLDERDEWQAQVFGERQTVAREISGQLDQHVVVVLDHLADTRTFTEVLQHLLRSSSVQTNSTARAIAQTVLPRQLLEFAERNDGSGLATASGIAYDRATRALSHLQSQEAVDALVQVQLEDLADFKLRDGATLKSVEELSAGQKCAVTLPIYLTDRERTLILDQPEDHLDNAYLVSHVVTGMVQRRQSGLQTIVATHNANIPVLGGADLVVAMQSDGVRGNVAVSGAYYVAPVVERITTLMEGGKSAFEARAAFYQQYGTGP